MKNEILIEVPAIKIEQRPPVLSKNNNFLNEYDFFIFILSSEKLLKIAKFLSRRDSPIGIQRIHKEDRDKEIGQFITSEHPFFPNTIIINIPFEYKTDFYDDKTKVLRFRTEEQSAYVIDGQHRLRAFASKYSKGVNLDLVVAAYFGLELPTVAEIFTRINYYQKPVSKSLVYDLLDFNIDPEFAKYKKAHEIVAILNSKIGSPFYGIIKMLGIGTGFISQAAFVEALTTKFKIIELFGEKYSKEEIILIIDSYFNAIKKSFADKWANENSILSRSIGFNALMKILKLIVQEHIDTDDIKSVNFTNYTEKMKHVDVDSEDIRSFGGFKGVDALSKKFITELKKSKLLRS